MQTPDTEMLEIKLKYSFTFCKNLLTNKTTNHITCFFSLQSLFGSGCHQTWAVRTPTDLRWQDLRSVYVSPEVQTIPNIDCPLANYCQNPSLK